MSDASRSYDHVLSFALEQPWAVTRPMLSVIANILARRIAGQEVDQATITAALVDRKNLPQPTGGDVALIPVYGVIAPRMNMMSDMSGGTTFESLTGQLHEALANKAVKTIVFDVNSPGGSVAGATEFAREVMKARTKKPIIAQAQFQMGSAAYWLGAAATEIVAAPSATIGSIGVYTAHDDISEALAKLGVKRTYLSAGTGKIDGHEASPLTAEATARIQSRIDEVFGRFVGDVVKGRGKGTTAETVRNGWKAHVYGADEALALGMIDRIGTLADTLARVMTTAPDAAARAPLSSTATDQEPLPATSQERDDVAWQNAIAGGLLELDL